MYKARLTDAGALRLNHPELAGEVIEYDGFRSPGLCIGNIFHEGRRLGGVLSFQGEEPGVELITRPDEQKKGH